MGTPQELTDAGGKIVWSAHYRAYGNVIKFDINEISNPLRFQGQYYDEESGLHYNRHRYYNPNTGRYLTPDPIKLAGGLNSYQYVPNPTGWVDPLGLMSVEGECPGQLALSASIADEIRAIPKGDRPDPTTYLSPQYISSHLSSFSNGATRFMPSSNLEKYGIGQKDGTAFVMPKAEVDSLLERANGNAGVIENSLGLPPGSLKDNKLLRIDLQLSPLQMVKSPFRK